MPTRYLAVNTLAGAQRSSSVVVESTTSGKFDSTYVANSIKVPSGSFSEFIELGGVPFLNAATSITGTLWYRFDFNTSAFGNNILASAWKALTGANNAYQLSGNGGGLQMQYWNTVSLSWTNWGTIGNSMSANTTLTLVIKLVLNTSFEVYQNGVLILNSAVAPTNGVSSVDRFRHGVLSNVGGFDAHYSQIMAADYDIRDAHFMSKLANGEGFYTDGTGVYTDINEMVLDDTNAITLPAVGNRHTFTKASITVPGGFAITSLVTNARGRVNGGTVVDGNIMCRSGTTNSSPGGQSYSTSYEPRMREFTTDPATASAWSQSGFNSAQFGLEAS